MFLTAVRHEVNNLGSSVVILEQAINFALFVHLFICALWSPAGKGLTSWLSFVVFYCAFVTFPLVSWVGVVLDCTDS